MEHRFSTLFHGLAKARRVETVPRLVSQFCPSKRVLGANNGLKERGCENMAINSTLSLANCYFAQPQACNTFTARIAVVDSPWAPTVSGSRI
jgi:hypothetical protein